MEQINITMLSDIDESEPRPLLWKFDATLLTLSYEHYEIDLERIRDCRGLVDWIFQIKSKTWATPLVMDDLITAFEYYLHPQRNYVYNPNPVSVKKLLQK